ncbi:MAG: hypothetical protein ACJAYU_000436 [Bradymonadia bacterium]|jgi:hypothetical protein
MRILVVAIDLSFLAACGSDPTYFSFGADVSQTDTGSSDTSDFDAVPAVCDDHADCAGGEICTEPVCTPVRAVSESSIRCELIPECEEAAGGYACRAGECVVRECRPNAQTCAGDDVAHCGADGSGYTTLETCGGDEDCLGGNCVGEAECTNSADYHALAGRCDATTLLTYGGRGSRRAGSFDYSSVTDNANCADSDTMCDAASLDCGGGGSDIACIEFFSPSPEGLYCVSSVCRGCVSAADCGEGFTCIARECEVCDCPAGFICTAGGDCVEGDPGDCLSDSECRDIAEAVGVDPDNVASDGEVSCFERGTCGGTLDPPCPAGLACSSVIDLLGGGLFFQACANCTVGDDSTCRAGEACQAGFACLSPDHCAAGGGGRGFPFS